MGKLKSVLSSLKFLCVSSCLIVASTQHALAATASGQATVTTFSDPTISVGADANFGLIPLTSGSSCALSSAGALSGDCIDPSSVATVGDFTISGLQPSVAIRFTLTGGDSSGTEITFVSTGQADDGTTTLALVDSVQSASSSFTTTVVPADVIVTVFGSLLSNVLLTAGTTYTMPYTLDVIYE